MKKSNYCGLLLNIPDRVEWIARNLNGVIYGYSEEPKWVKGEWVLLGGGVDSLDSFKWYIGAYEIDLLASESLCKIDHE